MVIKYYKSIVCQKMTLDPNYADRFIIFCIYTSLYTSPEYYKYLPFFPQNIGASNKVNPNILELES